MARISAALAGTAWGLPPWPLPAHTAWFTGAFGRV